MMNQNDVNNHSQKKLTVFQSSAIISGCGVGAGVMAIPFFASRVGLWLAVVLVLVAYFLIYIVHLLIAELTIRSGKGSNMVSILNNSKLFGKYRKAVAIAVFVLLTIVLTCDLSSYVVAAAELLNKNIPAVDPQIWKLIFYVFAAIVALFGLKVLGITEKYATIAIFLTIGCLIIASMFHLDAKIDIMPKSFKDTLVYTSIVMFAFNAFFSVPQVVEGLDADKSKVRKSIGLGMAFNALIILLVMIFCLLSSKTITNPCIEGWSESIGDWAKIVGLIFILLALFSSYWAISFSLRDLWHSQLKLNEKTSWLIATLPSLIISILITYIDKGGSGFNLFMSISSIVEATLLGLFIIPNFYVLRKEIKSSDSIFGRFGVIAPATLSIFAIVCICAGGIINIINEFNGIYLL